jgi:hypothetical protein
MNSSTTQTGMNTDTTKASARAAGAQAMLRELKKGDLKLDGGAEVANVLVEADSEHEDEAVEYTKTYLESAEATREEIIFILEATLQRLVFRGDEVRDPVDRFVDKTFLIAEDRAPAFGKQIDRLSLHYGTTTVQGTIMAAVHDLSARHGLA